MSYTELIKETLNTLDLNVIFEENCLRKEKINGQIKTTFPTVLHFDEFKSVRQVSGAMSFIILNGQTRKLFDIVENRQLSYLERYFNRFPLSVRENVQFIVIDIYTPYVFLVKKCFPKAKLIIDRFHIVQHIGRIFRNHRITWTNYLLKSSSLAEKRQGK